jgi:hypothetical protein
MSDVDTTIQIAAGDGELETVKALIAAGVSGTRWKVEVLCWHVGGVPVKTVICFQ